jgi:HK97 family phage major capsid protein
MDVTQMRERLSAILAELEGINLENATNEDIEKVNALNEEFTGLKAKIETQEKIDSMKASASISTRKTAPTTPQNSTPRVEVSRPNNAGNLGFKSAGEFYMSVKDAANGKLDKRLRNEHVSSSGEDGGFLIPEDFRTEIKEKVQGDESLLSMTDLYTTNSNRLVLPVNETAPWDNSAGVVAYWEGEARQYRESKEEFGNAELKLHKLTALVKATDELLEDAPALGAFIRRKAPQAIVAKINNAIIGGDGVGKPLGWLNSGFKIAVAKEAAQAADTIVYRNLVNMESRFMGRNGVWIAHHQCKEQLRTLKDDNGNFIYLSGAQFPNASGAQFDTLMGKPIIYMMGGVKQLGDEGDISLVDLDYYMGAIKTAGIEEAVSTHVLFDYDISVFKFKFRAAGHIPFKAPVQTEFGAYDMSAFITLEDRA